MKDYKMFILATCNLAVMFIESLQNIANAALVSEGATKKLGKYCKNFYLSHTLMCNTKFVSISCGKTVVTCVNFNIVIWFSRI